MSDAWEEIQALKSKRNTFREKLERRKKEREGILELVTTTYQDVSSTKSKTIHGNKDVFSTVVPSPNSLKEEFGPDELKVDREVEACLLKHLCDVTLSLPISSCALTLDIRKSIGRDVPEQMVVNFLQKFATQQLISIKECIKETGFEVLNADHTKLTAMVNELDEKQKRKSDFDDGTKPKKFVSCNENVETDNEVQDSDDKHIDTTDIMSLLAMPTIKEKESKKVGEEIMELLSKPTAKERSLAERFRSQGGATVMQFCPHGTKAECQKAGQGNCQKLHFKKIIQSHTDESLGDCSFLNTCFHMDTCKYVHYEVDAPKGAGKDTGRIGDVHRCVPHTGTVLYPPQWIQCDLRYLDMSVLGKFAVIMADPPWDIHMELPYGTLSDDEMRQLGVPQLQDDGLIFLWVTGRAMELGRECLKLWGYDRVDELIWVKTNQLQRIIRTGRTGHWLNHGKEHCLVGLKGNPPNLNRGLDCDVIVAEVRATSHKPDEIYGIIERLSPGTRKIELFGRPHNVQPNWITLGNQVDGVRLVDPELITAFREAYPDGNCMLPPAKP